MKYPKWQLSAALIWLILFGAGPAGPTQPQPAPPVCEIFAQADAELNRIYQQILAEYRAEPIFRERLEAAQRAWLVFRDAHLAALYPAPNKQADYGSVYPNCPCQALAEITRERTKVLRQWLTGVEEGEVCAGSIKIKP